MSWARALGVRISRGELRWALASIVLGHPSVPRVAADLCVSSDTANIAVSVEGRRVLIDDSTRFHEVRVLGVDEGVKVEVPWGIHQQLIDAYRSPDRACRKTILSNLIKVEQADDAHAKVPPTFTK
jgi:hypothetical protein